ncbi:ROK family transcriptional regulator [Protaetiibacter larvae]|uniref:ROK family transcriptional regulator n=1 Tax=Protaetiibacter larvae TaxID=2592654 RepID=A0A5C1YB75_9MICO|nr:ROK family transcriptional regulator [Protaetiibacter larvae]
MVDIVRSAGPISRVELAEATGLTQPAVSGIVRRLIADGVVRETGELVSTGGKPRALLEINSHAVYGVGVQLGYEVITCIVADTTGGVVGRQSAPGGYGPADEVTARIAELYRDTLEGLELGNATIAGLAVVAPGAIDLAAGTFLGPPAPEPLHGFPLRRELETRLGVPVLVENDAAAAAVGEFWSRQISRDEVFAVIYLGSGLGAGLVLDGALYRGSSSNATELGHVSIDPRGPVCSCGNVGCLERYASSAAVLDAARAHPHLAEALAGRDEVDAFDRLSRAAVEGDREASQVIEAAAARLADGALTLANLLDLDRIVLAGPGFAIAGSVWARIVQERLDARSFARALHATRVELASDPRDSAAIGAAALVLQGSVAPGHDRGAR